MPVYIGKSGDLVGCYRCLTDTQTTEDRATQLLYSIQFKLSHAILVLWYERLYINLIYDIHLTAIQLTVCLRGWWENLCDCA